MRWLLKRYCWSYCVAALMVLIPLLAPAQTGNIPPQAKSVSGATAHVYKTVGKDQLRLHAFKAKGANATAASPAIVFFFGGNWAQGSIAQLEPQAKYFADRGMVAILADYRVHGRHGTGPFEAIADAKSAIRWVRAHAMELKVDPSRIAASGGSSGGHIALSAAVLETFDEPGEDKAVSSKPNALVLFNPAVDATRPQLREAFRGRGADGSPLHHITAGLPPTLILHGKADQVVPYAEVERYCSEATMKGNTCRLVGYEGAPHGFAGQQINGGRWYRETLTETERFLTGIGYLQAPAKKKP